MSTARVFLTLFGTAIAACSPYGNPSEPERTAASKASSDSTSTGDSVLEDATGEGARPTDATGGFFEMPGTWSLGDLTLTIELRIAPQEIDNTTQAAFRPSTTLVAHLQGPLERGGGGSSLVFKEPGEGWFVFAEDLSRVWGYDGNEVLGRLTESGGGFELKFLSLDQDWAVDGVPIPMEVVERMPQPIRDLSGL